LALQRNTAVFVVEDHPATARALKMFLEGQGYTVEVANSLVCDLNLSDGTGWDFLKYLRTKMPVNAIAYSAYGEAEHRRRSREAGFAEHILKGSSPEVLVEAMEKVLGRTGHPAA
jgi:CheY-like chemotaxis protein